jgi:hypothetical protein
MHSGYDQYSATFQVRQSFAHGFMPLVHLLQGKLHAPQFWRLDDLSRAKDQQLPKMTVVLQLGRYSRDLMLYMIRSIVKTVTIIPHFAIGINLFRHVKIQAAHTAATRIGASSVYDLYHSYHVSRQFH